MSRSRKAGWNIGGARRRFAFGGIRGLFCFCRTGKAHEKMGIAAKTSMTSATNVSHGLGKRLGSRETEE